jgi:hypothetical protein
MRPPDVEERRPLPESGAPVTTTDVESTPYVEAWSRCPVHQWLYVSVLNGSWCVGDGDELRGHWVDRQVAA